MALPIDLCEPWTPTFTCALPTGSQTVSGTALELATETLYAMSGRQFGLCSITIRPCRQSCYGGGWPFAPNGWMEYGANRWPYPALIGGLWYNLACGGCAGECSCSMVHQIVLPGQVYDVTQVKVDGVVLTQDVDYRVDNGGRLLVRLGGDAWPLCNDLNEADTEDGTWSVTFRTGRPVPSMGQAAVGVLTEQFTKLLLCDDSCELPFNVTQLSRQGVDITFLDPQEIFANRRTGLYLPDLFINTYNPHGRTQRAKIYDIDAPFPRRVGT